MPRVEPGAASGEFLRIAYEGDVARLYVDGKLLTDNFYNGTPWVIGLDRIPSQQWDKLELKILPLHEARADLSSGESLACVSRRALPWPG